MATTQNAVNGRSGTVINKVNTTSSSITTYTTFVSTSATPTTGTYTQLCSLTISPESSSNVLVFDCSISFYDDNFGSLGVALFEGTTLLSSNWAMSNSTFGNCTFLYQQAAGTTSSTTYYIYVSPLTSASVMFPVTINADSSGDNLGGSLSYTFTITEEIA